MIRNDLKLVPVQETESGMYKRAVNQFLQSGQPETAVEGNKDIRTTCMGLRRAITDLELRGTLAVHQRKGQAVLERIG